MIRQFRNLLLWVMCMLAYGAEAQEKTLAVVFDTSGSMSTRFELPSYGVRLLASTLDGRAEQDRVFYINFTEYLNKCARFSGDQVYWKMPQGGNVSGLGCDTDILVKKFEMTNEGSQISMLRDLARWDDPIAKATPYPPIEIMLDQLAREVHENEEIILLVVVDGDFSDGELRGGRFNPQMTTAFERYRQRIVDRGGRISAKFLFIDKDGSNRPVVNDQGVRDTLLTVFNGSPSIGDEHVTGRDALWSAITKIIAEVSDIDRDAQRQFINFTGNTITVNSPLSISRIVVTTVGSVGTSLPKLEITELGGIKPTATRFLTDTMDNGDLDFNFDRLASEVNHMAFARPLPSGSYDLQFSGPVSEDRIFLIFETLSKTDLRIFEASGEEVFPNGADKFTLFTDTDYTFVSRILDGDTHPVPVELATLPDNTTMQLTLSKPGLNDVRSMVLDRARNQGAVEFRTNQTGQFLAVSRASAGILSPQSEPLSIEVIAARTELTISPIIPAVPCSACSAEQFQLPVTTLDGADVEIGRFDVTADATIDGQITFDRTRLPDGYTLQDNQGRTIDPNKAILFGARQTRSFRIMRPAAIDVGNLKDSLDLEIIIAPTGHWVGEPVRATANVLLTPTDMTMVLVDVTQAPTSGQLDGLLVPSGALLRGQFSAIFSLTDLLVAPDPAAVDDLVSVTPPGFIGSLVRFNNSFPDPRTSGGFHAIDARPTTSYWCLCFLGVSNAFRSTEVRDYTFGYALEIDGAVIQQASAPLAVHTPIAPTQFGLSCALDAFIFLLILMFIRGIFALILTHRFPRGSVMEINEGGSVPRFKRLDKGNSIWWKAWFALFTGNPDEVRTVEGLKIKATARGALVDVAKATPPWEVERLGESFADLKESRPKTSSYRLIWGDRMENTFRPTLWMVFKKRSFE